MRISRTVSVVGATAAIALSLTACGSSSSSKSSADVNKPLVHVASLTGTQTAVTLDMGTVAALTKLGVKVGTTGKAHAVTLSDGAAIAFPITGGNVDVYPMGHKPGYVTGTIDHEGSGLSFTVGKKVLDAGDFVVDPGNSVLTATITGGTKLPLFFLDGSALKISGTGPYMLDGTKVILMASAASAIDKYFGVPDGTVPGGAVIGTAHIVAA